MSSALSRDFLAAIEHYEPVFRINGYLRKDFNREVRNQTNQGKSKQLGETKAMQREGNFKKKKKNLSFKYQRCEKNIASAK